VVQRYAVLGKDAPSGVALRYIISSPSSYCYFSDTRLHTGTRKCNATYNNWKYGFGRYSNSYGASLLATNTTQQVVISRYFARDIRYLLGTIDDAEPADVSCEAMLQGTTRLDRGLTWWKYITKEFGGRGAWVNTTQILGVVNGVGHNAKGIYSSEEGVAAILNPPGTQFLVSSLKPTASAISPSGPQLHWLDQIWVYFCVVMALQLLL